MTLKHNEMLTSELKNVNLALSMLVEFVQANKMKKKTIAQFEVSGSGSNSP